MFIYFQPNPCDRVVGDCTVRALSAALNITWEEAYSLTASAGYKMCDMPSADAVWGAVLRQYGFYRKSIPNICPDCYTVEDFCEDFPVGIYVLSLGGHVTTIIDGDIYDSWDCSQEIPIYYWYKKGE